MTSESRQVVGMPPTGPSVGELGEREVLRRVLRHYSAASSAVVGPGDDCAVLPAGGGTVVTTDTMIEGPDFRLAWHSGFDLGWKLAATNLSDVAAMGAVPTGLTVAVACPEQTPVELLEEIARGLSAACETLSPGSGVIGGDLGRAPVLTIAITALGDLEGRAPILRGGARPGDTIAYAGQLGLAGIGLSLLFERSADEDGEAHSAGLSRIAALHPAALRAQLAPTPPIDRGAAAALAGATAMLDVSDGLAIDADRLARASAVEIHLSSELLTQGFSAQQGENVPLAALLFGGEDHGLLATFPEGAKLPEGYIVIGAVAALRRALGVGERAPLSPEDDGTCSAEHAAAHGAALWLDEMPCEVRGWDPFTVRLPGSDVTRPTP